MPTTLTNGIQLPDKGSVDWYSSMESNYNLIDTHLGDTDVHVTAEDKANWNSKQGSLSQDQLDAIAQVATNTDDIATLQSDKADVSHTHSSSDITDIDDYATKQYVDNSISGLVDNAPDALNTLNELSAALNDDSNFATTVTNALAAKANSADLATVATSGDYDDLSNKPTINDSTITIQKNGSTVDTFTTNGSAKTIDITVPTKTSDLTNDSNFVDISDPAVASGITSAKVTDYDTHIADTDIHVTTADKNKWNNQTYVFRYSSTALTASSTNSNTLLDNTDNLKVGDKVIDSDGVLFSITAIDTENSTFTIGTALIDLAQDSDVVHKSGDETISGVKSFINYFLGKDLSGQTVDLNDCVDAYSGAMHYYYAVSNYTNISNKPENKPFILESKTVRYVSSADYTYYQKIYTADYNATPSIYTRYYRSGSASWSNWIKNTDKFVTTDTDQTISGKKTFDSNTYVYNSDNTATTPNLYLKSSKVEISSQGNTSGDQNLVYLDKNNTVYAYVKGAIQSNGSAIKIRAVAKDSSDNSVINELQMLAYTTGNKAIFPTYSNEVDLGVSSYKWRSVFATNYYYGNDNVEFSTKFVTTDTNQTISGNKTFSSNVNVYNSDSSTDTANIILKNSKAERGSTTNIGEQTIFFLDKDNAQIGNIKCGLDSNGYSNISILCSDINDSSLGVQIRKTLEGVVLRPTNDNQCWLGQGGRRWYNTYTSKINGVEPSSLSLPSGNASDAIDISSYITDMSGTVNNYTAPANGWISIAVTGTAISIVSSPWSDNRSRPSDGTVRMLYPVLKGMTASISVVCTTLAYARFIPCQGNV